MLSIDFAKAFNRMSHNVCISELARRDASTETIQMVAAFLDRRTMRIKVNNTFSAPKHVLGGSPQGTKIGNYLFTVTVEAIEERNWLFQEEIPPSIVNEDPRSPIRPQRFVATPIGRFASCEFTHKSMPRKAGTSDGTLRYPDQSGRVLDDTPHEDQFVQPETSDSWTLKYIDDLNIAEQSSIDYEQRILSTAKEKRILHAIECQRGFEIVKQAKSKPDWDESEQFQDSTFMRFCS